MKKLCALFVMLSLCAAIGCAERKKGTFEKAGERVDEMVDNAAEGEPVLKRKGAFERAGENVDETVRDVRSERR